MEDANGGSNVPAQPQACIGGSPALELITFKSWNEPLSPKAAYNIAIGYMIYFDVPSLYSSDIDWFCVSKVGGVSI